MTYLDTLVHGNLHFRLGGAAIHVAIGVDPGFGAARHPSRRARESGGGSLGKSQPTEASGSSGVPQGGPESSFKLGSNDKFLKRLKQELWN